MTDIIEKMARALIAHEFPKQEFQDLAWKQTKGLYISRVKAAIAALADEALDERCLQCAETAVIINNRQGSRLEVIIYFAIRAYLTALKEGK